MGGGGVNSRRQELTCQFKCQEDSLLAVPSSPEVQPEIMSPSSDGNEETPDTEVRECVSVCMCVCAFHNVK